VNPVRGLDFGERAGKRAQVQLEQVEAVRALASKRIRVAIDLAVSTRPLHLAPPSTTEHYKTRKSPANTWLVHHDPRHLASIAAFSPPLVVKP
jgi:hypothetical protein